jgi:hypothetical protein
MTAKWEVKAPADLVYTNTSAEGMSKKRRMDNLWNLENVIMYYCINLNL